MNDQRNLLKIIAKFLAENKIPYMITGAWSAIYYGRPRASHDIDFVVEINPEDIQKAEDIFGKLPDEFLVQPESVANAVTQKNMFNIIHLPTMLKLDFWILAKEDFDQSRFKRRKKVKILNQLMEMASSEDTILQKLLWYQMGKIEKHLIDAAFVYQLHKKDLDKKYLDYWINKLRLGKYYQQLEKVNLEENL